MSRKFWAAVMFLSILIAGGAAYVMYTGLSQPEPQPVPLREVPPEEAPPMPAAVEPSTAAVSAAEAPPAPAAPADSAVATSDEKRNILFKLVRPNAKDVQIVGDFNNWMRKPMKKKAKTWELSVPLKPGSYEYAFIVDGKRVRDPNNKQTGSNGKSSVLTVKPLGKRP